MSKIALITDTHFGCRNDQKFMLEFFLRFFEEQFFPYLIKNNIKTVFHLGDVFDKRKVVSYKTLSQIKTRFFQFFDDNYISLHCILGNHDTYYRNTSDLNAFDTINIMSEFDFVKTYKDPCEYDKFLFLPWINDKNKALALAMIKNTKATTVLGHMEMDGFEVHSGIMHRGGLKQKMFERFDDVFSGHFHTKQVQNNIRYLGTPYTITWSDWGDQKGFYILDDTTNDLEFIENKNSMFVKVYYDDKKDNYNIAELDFSNLETKYVKVIVMQKDEPIVFNSFIQGIQRANPQTLNVIDDFSLDFDDPSNPPDEKLIAKTTIEVINDTIDDIKLPSESIKREDLKDIMKEVHIEALNKEGRSW